MVSVIIPAYNRAAIIVETLKSIAGQTYNHWECIIVDDHSTDSTGEVAQSFCSADARFKLFKNKRTKGAPGARNTGIEVCLGEYIIFLDSDDILLPHCIENRIKCIAEHSTIDVLVSLQKRLENGVEKGYVNIPSEHHPLVRFFCLEPVTDIPWLTHSILIRNKFIADNKIWWDESIKMHQDIQFNLALLVRDPCIYWSLSEFDSYWTFFDHIENVGSDLEELYEKRFKMLQVYSTTLSQISDGVIKSDVSRQYHSLVVWFALHYIDRIDIETNPLFLFLKTKTGVGKKNILILKLIRRLYSLKANFYLKQKMLFKLKSFVAKQFPSVVNDPKFLKVSKLPEILKQDLLSNAKVNCIAIAI